MSSKLTGATALDAWALTNEVDYIAKHNTDIVKITNAVQVIDDQSYNTQAPILINGDLLIASRANNAFGTPASSSFLTGYDGWFASNALTFAAKTAAPDLTGNLRDVGLFKSDNAWNTGYLYQQVPNIHQLQGKTITVGVKFSTTESNRIRLCVKDAGGTSVSLGNSITTGFDTLFVTHTVDTAASYLQIYVQMVNPSTIGVEIASIKAIVTNTSLPNYEFDFDDFSPVAFTTAQQNCKYFYQYGRCKIIGKGVVIGGNYTLVQNIQLDNAMEQSNIVLNNSAVSGIAFTFSTDTAIDSTVFLKAAQAATVDFDCVTDWEAYLYQTFI